MQCVGDGLSWWTGFHWGNFISQCPPPPHLMTESLEWTATALTSDYRNWSFAMDFINPRRSLFITLALQCMCSASASFDLKKRRNYQCPSHLQSIQSLSPVDPSNSSPLLSSHHSSDGTIVSISLF